MKTEAITKALKGIGWTDDEISRYRAENGRICQLIPLTEDEIRAQGRDYNPSEWDRTVDRYKKYVDAKFYKRDRNDSPNEYDEYFVVFTNPSGIKSLQKVSYSACLNNSPWVQVTITEDHVLEYVCKSMRYRRDDDARAVLADMSTKFGNIYTTNF